MISFASVALLGASASTVAADARPATASTPGKRPNILLIIGDDIGIDVTTGMYPGLIETLQKQYGPSGRNHPEYRQIEGRPASTPTLDAISRSGMRFTQAWVQ